MTLRVGLVTSSAGHTLRAFALGLRERDVKLEVVTDRYCPAEDVCEDLQVSHRRIEDIDRIGFSRSTQQHLHDRGADFVLLTFNRIVSAELFETIPTYNIHPSLLPAFPGLTALADAFDRRVRFVGATLHLVTEHVDGGPIIAQACAPTHGIRCFSDLEALSLVQRVYLALLAVELSELGALTADPAQGRISLTPDLPATDRSCPALSDAALTQYIAHLQCATQRQTHRVL